MTTTDRLAYLAGRERRAAERAASRRTLGQLIDSKPAVIRVVYVGRVGGRHIHTAKAFTADCKVIPLAEGRADAWVAWLLKAYPAVDWLFAHDYWPAEQRLTSAPGCDEEGGIPDEDQTFGWGGAPMLCHGRTWDQPKPFPRPRSEATS